MGEVHLSICKACTLVFGVIEKFGRCRAMPGWLVVCAYQGAADTVAFCMSSVQCLRNKLVARICKLPSRSWSSFLISRTRHGPLSRFSKDAVAHSELWCSGLIRCLDCCTVAARYVSTGVGKFGATSNADSASLLSRCL